MSSTLYTAKAPATNSGCVSRFTHSLRDRPTETVLLQRREKRGLVHRTRALEWGCSISKLHASQNGRSAGSGLGKFFLHRYFPSLNHFGTVIIESEAPTFTHTCTVHARRDSRAASFLSLFSIRSRTRDTHQPNGPQ